MHILGGSADDDQPPQLAKADAEAWHLHRANATPMPGAKSIVAADIDGDIDLDALVTKLGAEGLTRVFCEGGGAVAAGLLNDDLVDELIWMTAGVTIGADGHPATGALPFGRLWRPAPGVLLALPPAWAPGPRLRLAFLWPSGLLRAPAGALPS